MFKNSYALPITGSAKPQQIVFNTKNINSSITAGIFSQMSGQDDPPSHPAIAASNAFRDAEVTRSSCPAVVLVRSETPKTSADWISVSADLFIKPAFHIG